MNYEQSYPNTSEKPTDEGNVFNFANVKRDPELELKCDNDELTYIGLAKEYRNYDEKIFKEFQAKHKQDQRRKSQLVQNICEFQLERNSQDKQTTFHQKRDGLKLDLKKLQEENDNF